MEKHWRESAPARFPSASSAERALPTLLASYPRTPYQTTDVREGEEGTVGGRGWIDQGKAEKGMSD